MTACGKYEEGPGFSLKSKTKRLCREWKLDKIVENGEDITIDYFTKVPTHTLLFIDYGTDAGSLKETINTTTLAKGWMWGDKKETLIINYTMLQTPYEHIFVIRRLTSKEFWYNTTIEEKDYEFYWVVK